jgi:hypothetical protein
LYFGVINKGDENTAAIIPEANTVMRIYFLHLQKKFKTSMKLILFSAIPAEIKSFE